MKASVLLLGLAMVVTAPGQSVIVKSTSQPGASTPYDGSYSRSSQVTITGKIIGIGISKPSQEMSNNVRYVVQTLGKKPSTYLVEAGPQWFLNSQKTQPKLGQWVRVTGSKIVDHGETKILALQMQMHNHDVLALRRLTGVPYWVDLTPPATTQVTQNNTAQTGRLAAEGTILGAKTFTINGVQYAGYTVQTANGPANIIVAPPNYTPPVQSYNLGDNVRVFSSGYYAPVVTTGGMNRPYIVASSIFGPNGSVFVGPGMGFYPGYTPW